MMKKIIVTCFAFMLLLGASSCSDPYADELYDLKNETEGPGGGQGGEPGDNPPPPGG